MIIQRDEVISLSHLFFSQRIQTLNEKEYKKFKGGYYERGKD